MPVLLEQLVTRVPAAFPFKELFREPPIEALVVLPLHIGALLTHAVHSAGRRSTLTITNSHPHLGQDAVAAILFHGKAQNTIKEVPLVNMAAAHSKVTLA